MTTKAFLKTEEKKRGNSRVKEKDARDMTPITPVDANPPAAPTVAHTAPSAPVVDETVATEPASEQTAQMDDPAEDTVAKATTEEGQEAPPQLDNEVRLENKTCKRPHANLETSGAIRRAGIRRG